MTAELRVERIVDESAKWDAFVAAAPGSTFCHLFGWREVMTAVLRHEAIYLAAVDSAGGWRGVLPLIRVRSILGHYLISMPFLNDGGPLGDPDAQRVLVEYAVDEAKRSGAGIVELRSRAELPGPVEPSNRKLTVMLPLPESSQLLWEKTFRAKLRSQVRRPIKDGMVARSGTDQLDAFYDVFSHNMRDLGTPVLPRAFFETVARVFSDRVIFSSVRTKEGETAAAGCSLLWKDEIEIVWASSRREFNKLSPNMLLYAHTMETAIERGARMFNFGRCSPDSATHKFKLQWGGYDVPLPWPTWTKEAASGPPSPDRPLFRIATTAWSKLPVAVANRLGPVLARHLP